MSKFIELLAPAGNYEKMQTAFHFGADAAYFGGKNFGLRAYADNFDDEQIMSAVSFAHNLGKKVYAAVNIFASNADFPMLKDYLSFLQKCGVDAVIVSDVGVMDFVKSNSNLTLHVSTQANTTNKYAVKFWKELGAKRVVLAREVSLKDIAEIRQFVPDVELEVFVHGAMCISYSGRCLLSNYLTQRDGNRGECVQACRWNYQVREISRDDYLPVSEDARGTYIFNSKDLNLVKYVDKLAEAGVDSFKIEGRMKSAFYVATAVNAYRRAIDAYGCGKYDDALKEAMFNELRKAANRQFTTGFCFGQPEENLSTGKAVEESKFIAKVLDWSDGRVTVEQRNKFCEGDRLEVLSNGGDFNKKFIAQNIRDLDGNAVSVCNLVCQKLTFDCPYKLQNGDILRR